MAGAIVYRRAPATVLLIGLKSNLTSTWEKFFREKLPYYELHYIWETFKASKCEWRVLLQGYEALDGIIRKAQKFDWDMTIFDECQRLKSRSTKSSRNARKLRYSKVRLGLSGTPMDDSPIDLWAIFRFLDRSLFGINWGPFRDQYTRPSGYMGKTPLFKESMHGRFNRVIKGHVFRAELEDMGVARAKIKWHQIKLDPPQRRAYDRLEGTGVLKLGKSRVTAPLAITEITKLQQITSGWVYDDKQQVVHVGRAKAKDLRRWLLKHDAPVVIFCKFKPDLEIAAAVARQVFDRVGILSGALKDKPKNMARTNFLLDFQAGKYDVAVVQQKTGGAGVDLYRARRAYVYSCGYSYIDFDQMAARLTFLEQDGPAEFAVPYAPGTIDHDIRQAVRSKRSVTDVVWERLRRRRQ